MLPASDCNKKRADDQDLKWENIQRLHNRKINGPW